MPKRCVIQPDRRVRQLRTVTTLTCRWVADTTGSCFILLICHCGGFGGGGTKCLKERNGEDSFLSYGKRRISGLNISGSSIYCKNLHVSYFSKTTSQDNPASQEHVPPTLAATEPYPSYLTQELVDHQLSPLNTHPQMRPHIPA
jgi:hypothetical protein